MSIDVIRDVINFDSLIKRLSTKTMVTGDILIPDVKPDAEDIIGIDSELVIDGSEVTSGRVLVEGRVLSHILYSTALSDRPIAGVTAVKEFSHYFDAADADDGAAADIRGYVEHSDCDVLNSRKLQIKHMVSLDIFLSRSEKAEAVTAIDLEDAIARKEDIKARFMADEGSSETIVREDISPGEDVYIRDVLYASAAVTRLQPQISENKVLVEGTLGLDVIYMKDTEDAEYGSYSTDVNFSHFVDIADAQEFMTPEVRCVVEEVNAEPKDSNTIGVEAVLNVNVKLYQEDEKTIIKDVYSISSNLDEEKESFSGLEQVYRSNTQLDIKESVELADDVQHVLLVRGQAQPGDHEISDGKLYIDGVLPVSVYYIGAAGIKYAMEEVPFRHVADAGEIKEDDDIFAEFAVSQIYSTLNGNILDLRCTVDCDIRSYRENNITYISSVTESEDGDVPEMASITVYVADKDETLWDVAKRYRTTKERIMAVNELTEDKLDEGDRLIIVKECGKN